MTQLAYTLVPEDLWQGGQPLRPIVTWRADSTIRERYVVQVHLVDQYGHIWKSAEQEPQGGSLPTNQWIAGQSVQDQYGLHIDHTVPTGEYRITVQVYDPAKQVSLSVYDEAGNVLGEEITLATIQVQKSKASLTASQVEIEHRLVADVGEMRLLGYTMLHPTMRASDPFQIGLFWRALEKPRGDYSVVVQLRDTNGHISLEQKDRPAKGTYPTPQWSAGEVLLDWHDFDLPKNLVVGEYQIVVSLRDEAGQRTLGEIKITTIMITR
jgi:hypothetical protein